MITQLRARKVSELSNSSVKHLKLMESRILPEHGPTECPYDLFVATPHEGRGHQLSRLVDVLLGVEPLQNISLGYAVGLSTWNWGLWKV